MRDLSGVVMAPSEGRSGAFRFMKSRMYDTLIRDRVLECHIVSLVEHLKITYSLRKSPAMCLSYENRFPQSTGTSSYRGGFGAC